MAMRSPQDEKRRPIRDMIRRLIKAPAALSVLWPVLLVVGGYAAWHQWGSVHVANQYGGIDPTLIQVTEAPPHVRSNVVKAVYRDTAMEGLSLLDRQATAKIAAAFSMHPWVRKVIGVRKLPGGGIDVRLEYRTPVAMVHVFKPDQSDARSYFFRSTPKGCCCRQVSSRRRIRASSCTSKSRAFTPPVPSVPRSGIIAWRPPHVWLPSWLRIGNRPGFVA